jgi:hypothetical protein
MSTKQLIGITGALLIICGTFLPAVEIPILGKLSFYSLSTAKAIAVVVCGLAALAFAYAQRHKLQLGTSFVCLLLLGHTCYSLSERIGEFKSVFSGPSQATFTEFYEDMNAIATMSYGIPLIGIGSLLLVYTAVSRRGIRMQSAG